MDGGVARSSLAVSSSPQSPDIVRNVNHGRSHSYHGGQDGHGMGGQTQVGAQGGQGQSPWQEGSMSVHSPETPQSTLTTTPRGGEGHVSDSGHGHPEQNEEAKRPRACEACRALKVRCEMEEEGPCKRCRKAGRKCVVTVRTRTGERQRKTDTRVAELEKKIDALTASLHARGGAATTTNAPAGSTPTPTPTLLPTLLPTGLAPISAPTTERREYTSVRSEPPRVPSDVPTGAKAILREWGVGAAVEDRTPSSSATYAPPLVMAGQKRKHADRSDPDRDDEPRAPRPPPPRASLNDYTDIVDRGIITMERATHFFARYNEHMCMHLPGVIFPADYPVAELRKTKPLLFLSVMAAASNQIPSLQRVLVKELMQILGEKVICTGEKSLELVQAILVAVIWYWPPEHFEELKFYQLVHTAAVMAIDIGLGRKARLTKRGLPFMRGGGGAGPLRASIKEDPESIECRRTWLTCYYLASNTGMALHRPHLIRWSQFTAESVELLQKSPDAAPTDTYLCHLVRTNKLGEDIGTQFSFDEPIMPINLSETRTQFVLRGFERELEKHKSEVPRELMQPSLLISFETLSIFMHEIALHGETNDEVNQPSSTTESFRDGVVNPQTLTPAHIRAITICLASISAIFDAFLAMEVCSIRCLPVFNFVRVAYAVVVIIKIYFTAAAPDSELATVLPKEQIRVLYYLDNLLEKFRSTAESDSSRPAAKFLVVLLMLRSWFTRHGDDEARGESGALQPPAFQGSNGPGRKVTHAGPHAGGDKATPQTAAQTPASGTGDEPKSSYPAPPQGQHTPAQQGMGEYPGAGTANTGLQLLSEIATTDSGVGGRGQSHLPWMNRNAVGQPFMYDDGNGAASAPKVAGPGPTVDGSMAAAAAAAAAAGGGGATASGPMPWLSQAGAFVPELDLGSFGEALDWEGLTMNFGMGLPSVYENGVRNLMGDPMKPWFGETMDSMPADGDMYHHPQQQ